MVENLSRRRTAKGPRNDGDHDVFTKKERKTTCFARNTNIGLLLNAAQQVIKEHERFDKFFNAVTDAMEAGDK